MSGCRTRCTPQPHLRVQVMRATFMASCSPDHMKAAVVVLVLVGGTAAAIITEPSVAVDAQPDRIVFSSFRPSNWDIYAVDHPGQAPRRLTDDPALDYDPVFSPDGAWIVFTSERRGSPDLFAMPSDGSAPPHLLIESDAMEDQATISPDGKRIAFICTRDGNAEIFLLPFRPRQTQSLDQAINLAHTPGGDFRPAFSPDGKQIAFSSDRDSTPVPDPMFPFARHRSGEIYIMDADGQHPRRLTNSPGWKGSPTWSPDGKTLFFYSARSSTVAQSDAPQHAAPPTFGIWAMDIDGRNIRRISPEERTALSPAYGPHGRIFFATREGQGEQAHWYIASVASDGTGFRAETDREHDYFGPVYSPRSGAVVCYGIGPVPVNAIALPGGPLLATGFPVRARIGDQAVELYAIRHAFATPPHPNKDLLIVPNRSTNGSRLLLTDVAGAHITELVPSDGAYNPRRRFIDAKWSKDGEWITYMQGPFIGAPDAPAEIWKVRRDGSERVSLTPNSHSNEGMPDFSADGKRIVFRSGRSGHPDLYVMSAEGGAAQALTNDEARENFPAFSPVAPLIVFASDRDGDANAAPGTRSFNLYTLSITADGKPGTLRRITDTPGHDAHPTFSPDGRWIIYTSECGGLNDEEPLIQEVFFSPQIYGEIYAQRLSDGFTVRLTHNKWEDGAPFWVHAVK